MLVKDTLIELCNFARENSCFYRELYKNKTINNLEEFYSLPFVNSDIYKYDYHHISTSNNLNYKSEYAFSSGGSTGEPKYIYLTDEEFHLNIKMHGSFYSKAGIEKTDRVAIFGIPGQLTSEFSVYLGLESTECFILPIGIYDDFDKISDLISHFKINTLLLMPTDAISLINYYKFNTKKLKIDKIITGGEPLTISMKKTITDYCEKVHFGFTYQSMDFGTVGYNDGNLEFNQVIVNNPYQIIEVVDKGGNKVENNEIGELIVTNLSRKLIPIIRFKTGDLVRFDGNKLLTILGRLSNIPKIGGEKFQLDVINEYLEDNRSFTGRYQYILSKRENIDHILLKLELVDHIADSEEVKLELKRIFFEQFPKLDKQIKNKAVHDIELEFAVEKEIGFILSKGTGKIRNLVDRRQEYEI